MSLVIRPFRTEDFEALAVFLSETQETVVTPEALRYEWENTPPKVKFAVWVAEHDGKLVGSGQYSQHLGAYHPRKFRVYINVHPTCWRQGIGTALYETVTTALQEHDPIALSTGAREDRANGIRFAEKHGFKETMRTWESHLELSTPEPPTYASLYDAVIAQGYEIRSFTDLASDPERDRKLHALHMEVRRDIPSDEPWTDVDFEEWVKGLKHPHFYGDGYFVAIKGDEWVGISSMRTSDEEGVLNTGVTAIKRAHRGIGLAKALKLHAVRHARAAGFSKMKTFNESNNQRMLKINDDLGFVRKPAWISYKRGF
ncbi:MAG: GNAT family N-acetyltransferase [Bacillota bacterium]